MNNQKLTSIALSKSSLKRERFNMSHDVNTTSEFGAVQPLMCKCIVPNTKSVLDTRSLTRLAPMVAPAFGRVKLKIWHEFVSCADVCKSFDSVMSQQPTYRGGVNNALVETVLPWLTLRSLSSLVLAGARMTIYYGDYTAGVSNYSLKSAKSTNGSFSDADFLNAYQKAVNNINGFNLTGRTADSITENNLLINHWCFGNNVLGLCNPNTFWIPLSNAVGTGSQHIAYDFSYNYDSNGILLNNPVSLASADLVYEIIDGTKRYAYAFRLSDFGKRLRKILIGCGYQIDLKSETRVSLLPLFAYYKAYWNLFGLTQWQNWETTHLCRLIEFLYSWDVADIRSGLNSSSVGANLAALFGHFINDLGQCFYNDSADFVSAHLPSTAVSPTTPSNFEFVDVIANQDNVTEINSQGTADGVPASAANGHSFISTLEHGYLDEEYLKKLYRWTNRNTIIGRKIREVMRAQGLGKYMDAQKTDFIGYTDDIITISDVVSTADTDFGNGSGKLLGEYGGRGLGFTQSKTFSYENEEFGYWITLCAIVPESGYMQQLDKSVTAVSKFQFPNPDFDSMGFEANKKQLVQGSSDWSTPNDGSLDSTFGFAPRYFAWKFATNVNNGDITLRSERDTYLPYTLDKFIPVNDRVCEQTNANDPSVFACNKGIDAQSLPDALFINLYRSIGKYAWFGNYDRIFANNTDLERNKDVFTEWSGDTWSISLFPYFVRTSENFLIHNILNYQMYAPMLAVEDSFETHDEDEKPNMSVHKA